MKKLSLLLLSVLFVSTVSIAQTASEQTVAKTAKGDIILPGKWKELNRASDSGQTYYTNTEGVVIAVAQNPKKAYPCYKAGKSDFENVKLFYVWDSDYMIQNKLKTAKLKENADQAYIVWKFNDGKLDNIFLFGSIKENFLNLLVYTDKWTEEKQIAFLEGVYRANR